MQYQFLKEKLKDFSVFTLTDIRKLEPKFHRRRLSDWQEKGYIKKLRRGYYVFADTAVNEESLFLIANHLYAPSYVSFESALSYYGLIPEGVYSITSACGIKTVRFSTPIAEFSYQRMKPGTFFGYELRRIGNQSYKIAEIEKVFLDYVYANPKIATEADFYEWRFNSEEFLAKANRSKLLEYASAFHSKGLLSRLNKLLELMQRK